MVFSISIERKLMNLLTAKNAAILDLQRAKLSRNDRRTIISLASKAAALETQMAEKLLEMERGPQATVNFLSAASCMKDARRFPESARLLDRAKVYAENEELIEFMKFLKLEYPVLWTGMKSFPAEGRGKCAMQST